MGIFGGLVGLTKNLKPWQRIDEPLKSVVKCPCGSEYEWVGKDGRLYAWMIAHRPHCNGFCRTVVIEHGKEVRTKLEKLE